MPFKDYRITSPFGWRNHPVRGTREFHTGIDLVKSHQAPIPAFTEGEVLFSGMGRQGTGFGGYGNVVLVKDKNNRGQVYAHLDSVSVKRGDRIRKDQVIGRQGNTGVSTGSHLHYEVRKRAQSAPPFGWEADRANNCLEPTKYLNDFNKATAPSSTVLRRGSKGNTVKELQEKLLAAGERLPRFGADGDFGKETEDAVKAFQSKHKLTVDGIAGPQTFGKLDEVLSSKKRTLHLPANVDQWRIYDINVAPVRGNEKAFLRPSKFNGLTYEILDEGPEDHTYIIQTRDFGKVKIFAGPSTSAVINS